MSSFKSVILLLNIVLCSLWMNSAEGLKILAIFPHVGRSHHFVIDPLINRLSEKGHEVTVVSPFPSKNPLKNRKEIVLVPDNNLSEDVIELGPFDEIPRFLSMIQVAMEGEFLAQMGYEGCINLLENTEVKKLLKSNTKFDVALVEQFNSDCLFGIIHKFGIPSIGITADTLMPWHYERLGITTNPSYLPCHHLSYGTKPNFWQTVSSLLACGELRMGYYLRSTLKSNNILRQHFGENIPHLDDLTKSISMILVNSYFTVNGAFPLPPNVKEVGGLHLKNATKLPEDIQKYIDDSPHGVIYFSMGSMIKTVSMPPEKLAALQDAFAQLPQRVLWKWENETMPGIPKNVMVRKWLPQFDILNHKNVKVFISHGGMLSTTEAAHCGVPMVTIPLYGDQFSNAAAVQESGLGTILEYRDITKETVLEALNKVLDPKMQESAKRVSAVWNDRPMGPLETAVYWVEHVARHGGSHLRPASADLPLYRYLLLDVLAFLAVVGLLLAFIFFKIFKCLLKCTIGRIVTKKSKND